MGAFRANGLKLKEKLLIIIIFCIAWWKSQHHQMETCQDNVCWREIETMWIQCDTCPNDTTFFHWYKIHIKQKKCLKIGFSNHLIKTSTKLVMAYLQLHGHHMWPVNKDIIFPRYGDSHVKIRWSQDCLMFNMGIPILVRRHLYFETSPRLHPDFHPMYFDSLATGRLDSNFI